MNLTFAVGDCSRSFLFADVVDDSTLSVGHISLDCAGPNSEPIEIQELFHGVVHSIDVTAEVSGQTFADVLVCVSSGGQHVERLLKNINTGDPDTTGFAVGDLVEVDGSRDGADIPQIDFTTNSITVLGADQSDPCAG